MIVSGFSESGYRSYGSRFLETFDRFWPKDVRLAVYVEKFVAMPRGSCRSLWDCPGASEFYDRHKDNSEHCGRKQNALWRAKDVGQEYAWRFDALKWFRQCLIPDSAADGLPDGEILCWLDADVITHHAVPAQFVEDLLGSADLVYLGRKQTHSEIGFWAVRLGPLTRAFVHAFAEMWRTDEVFEQTQWHSAFIFDIVRERFMAQGMNAKDLTPGGRGHVWHRCPELSRHLDHLKGEERKARGSSFR